MRPAVAMSPHAVSGSKSLPRPARRRGRAPRKSVLVALRTAPPPHSGAAARPARTPDGAAPRPGCRSPPRCQRRAAPAANALVRASPGKARRRIGRGMAVARKKGGGLRLSGGRRNGRAASALQGACAWKARAACRACKRRPPDAARGCARDALLLRAGGWGCAGRRATRSDDVPGGTESRGGGHCSGWRGAARGLRLVLWRRGAGVAAVAALTLACASFASLRGQRCGAAKAAPLGCREAQFGAGSVPAEKQLPLRQARPGRAPPVCDRAVRGPQLAARGAG